MPYKEGGGNKSQPYNVENGRYTKFEHFAKPRDYDKGISDLESQQKGLSFPNPKENEFNSENIKHIEQFQKERLENFHSDYGIGTKEYEDEEIDFLKKWQDGNANKDNFFYETTAKFERAKQPNREPDYTSYDRNGNISSQYWYTNEGVYRRSNHWGSGIASCNWYLGKQNIGEELKVNQTKSVGFAKWEDFYHKPRVVSVQDENGNKKMAIETFSNRPQKDKLIVDGKEYISRYNDYGTPIWESKIVIEKENKEEEERKNKLKQEREQKKDNIRKITNEFMNNPKEFAQKNNLSYREFISKKSGEEMIEINNQSIQKKELKKKFEDGSSNADRFVIRVLKLENPFLY